MLLGARASSLSRATLLSLSSTVIVLVRFGLFLVETVNFSVNSSSCYELGYADSNDHVLSLRISNVFLEASSVFGSGLSVIFAFEVSFPCKVSRSWYCGGVYCSSSLS